MWYELKDDQEELQNNTLHFQAILKKHSYFMVSGMDYVKEAFTITYAYSLPILQLVVLTGNQMIIQNIIYNSRDKISECRCSYKKPVFRKIMIINQNYTEIFFSSVKVTQTQSMFCEVTFECMPICGCEFRCDPF